ncbi:Alkaline phosphatase synthesis sensor protein PhoR [Limihaloglobus sulfuriphilus]|uniref:histidine kinase n=1 Tax=Limihaloglobus sulfuriphilus TaxID=1851148 RepID=A0A1Q2MHH1_9BACT|nr:HAMP domain-containing sensor histidine kinase [Limihaloglobus sulfuriphilus]AQQ72141.1 Alkaline phosphatase synthesis sensor protein PhoR [Limihaloglobus sulfuriphilus]
MYKRLTILAIIILGSACGLALLGRHAIIKWADGLAGSRYGEFTAVAEQIRLDVRQKIREFIDAEQQRPYSDYQYAYVPENLAPDQQEMPLLRSPLADKFNNGLAGGYFQIESDGTVITPYLPAGEQQKPQAKQSQIYTYIQKIKSNLLGRLNSDEGVFFSRPDVELEDPHARFSYRFDVYSSGGETDGQKSDRQQSLSEDRTQQLSLEVFSPEKQQAKVIAQKRSVVTSNRAQVDSISDTDRPAAAKMKTASARSADMFSAAAESRTDSEKKSETSSEEIKSSALAKAPETAAARSRLYYEKDETGEDTEAVKDIAQPAAAAAREETVQIRIEPFVPVFIEDKTDSGSIFNGSVFMLRHITIEDKHFMQGFRLNENELLELMRNSARRFIRSGMRFEVDSARISEATLSAVLDFEFGGMVINLFETDPLRLGRQVSQMKRWYAGIIAVVMLAVGYAMFSVWKNMHAQLQLAKKKDDFISAVSHELRTPLTSIRMYSEMLENGWVSSPQKTKDYYRNMRTESERLSRLVDNVLDFSRIQKGRKEYAFAAGNINDCVGAAVNTIRPYAVENGFELRFEPGEIDETKFDSDAVTQILVNLIDNAIKYARNADDKTIIIRTLPKGGSVFIEVEDRGPGIPHSRRKKIFEEFYRLEDESTRETTGSGLGLALVRKFAQAHGGFVDFQNIKPTGVVFRVCLK